jgi:hypothetical protein
MREQYSFNPPTQEESREAVSHLAIPSLSERCGEGNPAIRLRAGKECKSWDPPQTTLNPIKNRFSPLRNRKKNRVMEKSNRKE